MRQASKFNTPAEICPFTSIFLLLCQFVVMEGHCSLVVFLHFYTSPGSLLFLFCLSYELSMCCLVEGAERFSFLSPILSVSLRKYAVKRADYWMALKLLFCLQISQSTSFSLAFILASFFGLSLTPPSPFYHLISSEDEDW